MKQNQNAHVYAKMNEDYFSTSKVIVPTDEIYNRQKYTPLVKEAFRQLKREFTGKSQDHKVTVNYIDLEADYITKRRQVFQVKIEQDVATTGIQSLGFADHELADIVKSIPMGFKLSGIRTSIYNSDIHNQDRFIGTAPKTHVVVTAEYEKKGTKTKKI